MKNKRWILPGIILLTLVVTAAACILRAAPRVNHALEIAGLLEPWLGAENQRIRIAVSAGIGGELLEVESDVYLVTEGEKSYLALERKGTAVYVSENILILENGKAFKLGQSLQTELTLWGDLLPRVGELYEALKITARETGGETAYAVTVTGDQVDMLLAAVSPGGTFPVEGIEKLELCLEERDGKLQQITFSGRGSREGTVLSLQVTISDFRLLAAGDYPIPAAVRERAATVDPDGLFSLTEDLYRLVLALAPLGDMETVDGTLALTVDCGLLQLDTQLPLSNLGTNAAGQLDPENLRKLPELLGFLCMEGDIRCHERGNGYAYELKLDRQTMQQLARMILPELARYGDHLTEGSVAINLEHNAVASMEITMEGKIPVLAAQVPIVIALEFVFA